MPAEAIPTTSPSRERERLVGPFVSLLVVSLGITWFAGEEAISRSLSSSWPTVALFVVLVVLVNLFPIAVGSLRVTLDFPLLLAAGMIFRPEAVSLIAFLATADPREWNRRLSPVSALFNRAQVALSSLAASLVFHAITPDLTDWRRAGVAALLAVVADYAVNTSLITVHEHLSSRVPIRATLQKLWLEAPQHLLTTFLGYGLLALAWAYLHRDVGLWPLPLFVIPLLAARQLLLSQLKLRKAASELASEKDRLRVALLAAVDERKDERRRIAGELHDDVLQELTQVRLLARVVAKSLDDTGAASPIDVDQLVEATDQADARLRRVLSGIRESPLGQGGLLPALESLLEEARIGSRCQITAEFPGSDVLLSPVAQVVLYQVAREAVQNAVAHGSPSRVEVKLAERTTVCRLEVADDGCGFDAELVDSSKRFGLQLMEERVISLGGSIAIDSGIGKGTRVVTVLPVG